MADKNYSIDFTMSDGSTESVEFTVPQGERGTGILPATTGIASYTTTVNGIKPTYRIALSTLKTQAGVNEVLVGDQVRYSYYLYPVIYVDADYAYMGTRVSIRGAIGDTGYRGNSIHYRGNHAVEINPDEQYEIIDPDIVVGDLILTSSFDLYKAVGSTSASIYICEYIGCIMGEDGSPGKTPVKGTDYFTPADKTEMVNAVISALPKYAGEVS